MSGNLVRVPVFFQSLDDEAAKLVIFLDLFALVLCILTSYIGFLLGGRRVIRIMFRWLGSVVTAMAISFDLSTHCCVMNTKCATNLSVFVSIVIQGLNPVSH